MPLSEMNSQQIALAAITTGAAAAGALGLWMLYRRRSSPKPAVVAGPRHNEVLGKVKNIVLYPVKSVRGIELDSAECLMRGLKYDRRFIIVNTAATSAPEGTSGDFLNLLKMPKMAQIQPGLEEADGKVVLTLQAEGYETIRIAEPDVASSERVSLHVYRTNGEGIDCGDEVAAWLANFTGLPSVRMYFMSESVKGRHIPDDPKWGSVSRGHEDVSFANFAPFMLCTQQSLTDINARVGQELEMARFRPNIIVESSSSAPYQEDDWKSFKIAGIGFYILKKCGRCPMTQMDPNTGEKTGPEPLSTLREFRLETSDSRYANSPIFGIQLAAEREGTIRVGDQVVFRSDT